MIVREFPQPAQIAVSPFHAVVVPGQRILRRTGEHHEEARGIRAILVDQCLRIHAVVLGLRHGADAARLDRLAVRLQDRAGALALLVECELDISRIEILDAAAVRLAGENLVQHHALRQQARKGLVKFYQAEVAHDLGPETRIKQVQDGVLDAADVLIHRQPVVHPLVDHFAVLVGAGVAQEIPG